MVHGHNMARSQPVDDLGHPIQYDPDFNGPLRRRSCTDIICLFLFLAFIACWIGIGIYAFKNGDPNTLLVPKDSSGSRCGLDYHVKDKPYLFFFDLTKCLSPAVPFTGCPTKQVCMEKCPSKNFIWQKDPSSISDLICDYNVAPKTVAEADDFVNKGLCARWYLESSPFEGRCIPAISEWFETVSGEIGLTSSQLDSAIKNLKVLSQAEQIGQNIVNDLINSWWKILIGVAIGVVACLIFILIMRWIAAIMVWLSIVGVVALLAFCVYFTATKFVEFRDHPVEENNDNMLESYLTKKDFWLVLMIIASILLGVILLILVFLRGRIVLAIALIEEGSKAVSSVTSVLVFPIFPWLLQIGVIAFAVCVGLYLSTTGEPLYKIRDMDSSCHCIGEGELYMNNVKCVPSIFNAVCPTSTQACMNAKCKFIAMQNPAFYPYLLAIDIVGFLWLAFFVSALGQMILASVFATWYWTFKKRNLPFFAVTDATLTVLRYHIGTLAFGSLIVTICRIIRLLLEYIDQQLKKYDNGLVKAILCCCKCCFWCLEKFIKFINRNAYIMCAIHGKNFCASARDAFMLLMRNIIRVFVLDKVTDFLFFLGKLLITVGVGCLAYVIFATDLTAVDNSGLNYNFVPVIAIMICTYLIATIFFSVYSMAVDTLFLCFLEDCERNDGSPEKPYYMSKNLMKIFGKKNKKH